MERKLSRSQFLKTDINDSVEAIVDNNGAPLALRLSGQLLLGVVRIYSRKTVYLMEDCNEALLKLKMAFRSGNVDMERNTTTVTKAQTLTLQNKVTDLDLLLLPEPNLDLGPGFPMLQKASRASSQHVGSLRDITLPDLDDTIDIGRGASRAHNLDDFADEEDLDLGLDFGLEEDRLATLPEEAGDVTEGQIEIGLEAPQVERSLGDELGMDESMGLDLDDDMGFPASPDANLELVAPESPATPTHDADILGENVSVAIDFDHADEAVTERSIVGDDEHARAAQAAVDKAAMPPPRRTRTATKRRAQVDDITEIRTSNSQIIENRKTIIKEHSALPADPKDFALFTLSHDANKFVNSLYHPIQLHPEISRLVNPEFVSQMMKRKRSLTDISSPETAKAARTTSPEPELDDEENRFEDTQFDIDVGGEGFADTAGTDIQQAESPRFEGDFDELDLPHVTLVQDEEGAEEEDVEEETGSVTAAAAASGISRNTIKAVSLLRENLKHERDSAFFGTMLGTAPTKSTKVKMFFEMLVLATKDAVKLEQQVPFGDITVAAKNGLFGSQWDAVSV